MYFNKTLFIKFYSSQWEDGFACIQIWEASRIPTDVSINTLAFTLKKIPREPNLTTSYYKVHTHQRITFAWKSSVGTLEFTLQKVFTNSFLPLFTCFVFQNQFNQILDSFVITSVNHYLHFFTFYSWQWQIYHFWMHFWVIDLCGKNYFNSETFKWMI